MKLSKKQQDELDALMDAAPLSITDDGRYAIFEDWGAEYGEDICVEVYKENSEITIDDLKAELESAIECFDSNEYVRMYIDSLGKRGVPETVEDLLKAAYEHKAILETWLSSVAEIMNRENGEQNNVREQVEE